MNETFELNEAEKSALLGLYQKFFMEAEADMYVLADCGWGDFEGISFGGGDIRFDGLVAEGYLQKRPHHIYGGYFVYRCGERGMDVASDLQDEADARLEAALSARPAPPLNYDDEIPF